jgi:hypothetical protein
MKTALKMIVAAVLVALSGAASVAQQIATPGLPLVPLGYCQLTSIDAATKISTCSGGIPAGATIAYLIAETQAIRLRDDGVAPTASVGFPIAVASPVLYTATISSVQVISQVAGAKLDVLFYKSP